MELYSIACVDLAVERLAGEGGYRIGDAERYRVCNCEWVAEFTLHRGWCPPCTPTLELEARFGSGNRQKFARDLELIGPRVGALFGAADAALRLRTGLTG